MTASAETHQLSRIVDIGFALVVSVLKCRNVDQKLSRRRLAGKWMYCHFLFLSFVFLFCSWPVYVQNNQLKRYHKFGNLEWLSRSLTLDQPTLYREGLPRRLFIPWRLHICIGDYEANLRLEKSQCFVASNCLTQFLEGCCSTACPADLKRSIKFGIR